MHDLHETMEWYRDHNETDELGFNPDGRCLQICRTARDLPAVYPSAKASQDATPPQFRVTKIADLRKGMVLYFDDPHDSNVFGHVATMVGRVKGFDEDSLHDVLVKTNSVKSGEIVVVRGDYFDEHWGDEFQFGAAWLNGRVLDVFTRKPDTELHYTLVDFRESRPEWDVNILDWMGVKRPEIRTAARQIAKTVEALPDDKDDTRVKAFKNHFNDTRRLKMSLLNDAVKDGRTGEVLEGRNKLRALIKSVLPR